jgi:phospholipase D1/2
VDSSKIGNENDGIKNAILDALAERIDKHIQIAQPFHVYLVLPVHPEGPLTDDAICLQHWLALVSIKHGSNSLINRTKRALKEMKRDPEEWVQYLTVLNMRNYGATVLYARDPKTSDNEYAHEIGRFVVTEQIYIHSKLLIVDDAVAIVGSANLNDRSLTGNGDTEIAAVVVDTEGVELRDLGSPEFQVQTRKFARELRRELWRKHFGFAVRSTQNDSQYFNSTTRAVRAQQTIPAALLHPPRLTTTVAQIFTAGNRQQEWNDILDKPCHPNTVKAIQAIAKHNAGLYEEVFQHTPRNSFDTFNKGVPFYTQNYPLLSTRPGGDGKPTPGVIPPALQKAYMTADLPPHLHRARNPGSLHQQALVYEGGTVHNVDKTIEYLRANIVGFFIEAPLSWGIKGTKVPDDPTGLPGYGVDLSANEVPDINRKA